MNNIDSPVIDIVEQDMLLKVLIAVAAGALLGLEREYRHKAAGMRTLTLICVGSTLFTLLSVEIGYPGSADRIASNILTGVGFIGAGVIFKGDFSIDGITTAATIWIAAALGISIGMSHYVLTAFTLGVVLAVLLGLKWVEKYISSFREKHTYTILYYMGQYSEEELNAAFKRLHIRHRKLLRGRKDTLIEEKYEVSGHRISIKEMNAYLQNNMNICQFEVQTNPL